MNNAKNVDSFCEVYLVPYDTYHKIITNLNTNDKNNILNINKTACSENSTTDPLILNSKCDNLSNNTDTSLSNQLNNATNNDSHISAPQNDITLNEFNPDPRRASTPIPSEMSMIDNSNNEDGSRLITDYNNENIPPIIHNSIHPPPPSNLSSYTNIPDVYIPNDSNPDLGPPNLSSYTNIPNNSNSRLQGPELKSKSKSRKNKHQELMDLMERVRRSCEDGLISTITSLKEPNSNINIELTNKYNQFVKTLDDAERKLNNLMQYPQFNKKLNYSLPNINFKSFTNKPQNISLPQNQSIQNSLNISRSRSLLSPNVSSIRNNTPLNISRNPNVNDSPQNSLEVSRSRSHLSPNVSSIRNNAPLNISRNSIVNDISRNSNLNNTVGRRSMTSSSTSDISSLIQPPRSNKRVRRIVSSSPSDSDVSNLPPPRKIPKKKKEYNLRKRDPAILRKMQEQLKSSTDSSVNISHRSRSPIPGPSRETPRVRSPGPSRENKSFSDWSTLSDTLSSTDTSVNRQPKRKTKRKRMPSSSSSSSHNDISYIINEAKRRKILKKKPLYNLRKRDPELLRRIQEQLKSSSDSSFIN